MKLFSLLLVNFEIEFNFDFFETNIFNILLIFGYLIYVYKSSYKSSLEIKQKEINQLIYNSEKNLLQSINFYFLAEKFYFDYMLIFSDIIQILKKKKILLLLTKIEDFKKLIVQKKKLIKGLIVKNKINKLILTKQYLIYLILLKIIKKYLFESSNFKNKTLNSILSNLKQ